MISCTVQTALTSRNPNSLPAVIAASKPNALETALVADLQQKLQKLQVSHFCKNTVIKQ